MQKSILLSGITAFCVSFIMASAVSAETRLENVVGVVTKVDVLTTSYTQKTPRDEKICSVEDVPVYSQTGQHGQAGQLESLIIGGLIGSAVGNQLTDADGGGAAGAVAGALIGHEHARASQHGGSIVGYRQQELCKTKRVVYEEQVTKITGYRIQIDTDGRLLTLESSTPKSVGDRVEIRKQVNYSIR